MIYLKKVNEEDIDEEYNAIKKIPANENGFVNKHYNVTKDEFINQVIPELLNHSNGIVRDSEKQFNAFCKVSASQSKSKW